MEIIAFIRDPVMGHKILGLGSSSENDPLRGPPNGDRHYEPVYDEMPPGDELLSDG